MDSMGDNNSQGTPEPVSQEDLDAREIAARQRHADSAIASANTYTAPKDGLQIKALTGDDRLHSSDKYHSWSRSVEATLKAAGPSILKVYLGGDRTGDPANTAAWDACDSVAFAFTQRSLHADVNYLAADLYTANGLRLAIQKHFAPNDSQGVVRQYEALFSQRIVNTTTVGVDDYIKTYSELHRSLTAAKVALPDKVAAIHVLSSLPPSLAHIRSTLNVQNAGKLDDLPSLHALFDLIRSEARTQRAPVQAHSAVSTSGGVPPHVLAAAQEIVAAAATITGSRGRKPFTKLDKSKPCHLVCLVPGCNEKHWLEQCTHAGAPAVIAARSAKYKPSTNAAVVASVAVTPLATLATHLGTEWPGAITGYLAHTYLALGTSNPQTWLDSGTNFHIAKLRAWFSNYRECVPEPVQGIAGSIMAVGLGDVTFLANLDDGKKAHILFKNVLHVPDIAANLISISRLARGGLTTEFGGAGARITLRDGALHAKALLNKTNLYSLDGNVVLPPRTFAHAATTSSPSLGTWHNRFSHLHPRAIQKLSSKDIVDGLSISGSGLCSCNPCQVGKATRLPFPRSLHRSPTILYRAYADLLDVSEISRGGARYLLVIGDDHSRKLWGFPIGRKSECFEHLRAWLLQVQTFTGLKLKQFGSDGGGEFLNMKVDSLLLENGTERFTNTAYTSPRNSRSERPMRTIANAVRTVRAQSGLGPEWWAEIAMSHLVTKNVSPHAALDDNVPDAIWNPSTRPDVSFLRPIGCKATMTILRKQERGKKMDVLGRDVILVGYARSRNAYRVWDRTTNLIHESRDVTFEETVFPLKLDNYGGDQLNSAPPSVRPGGEAGDPDLPLTFSDNYGSVDDGSDDASDQPAAPPSPITDANRFRVLDVEEGDDADDELAYSPPALPPTQETPTPDSPPRAQNAPTPAAPRASRTRNVKVTRATPPVFVDREDREESPDPLDLLSSSDPVIDPFIASFANAFDDETIYALQAAAAEMLGEDELFSLPSTTEPTNYREALKTAQAKHWQVACDVEIAALERLHVWDKLDAGDVPASHRPIGSKFVLKAKKNKRGIVVKYKARLVAQGFSQRPGIDFKETFAPVAKFSSIRLLLALAAKHKYHVEQADVDSAFPQAELDASETVYVKLPDGMRDLPAYVGCVLRLRKALYGLKQSGRVWNLKIHKTLTNLGYRRTRTDACVYVLEHDDGTRTYIALYVDDLLFVGPSMPEIQRIKNVLQTLYGIKDLGAAEFILGIQIIRDASGGITLLQKAYLEAVLARFKMGDCRPLSTPMEPNLQLRKGGGEIDLVLKRQYLQAIGSLMYAMLATRPDLCHSVGYLSRFSDNPKPEHWNAIQHVLRYIRGTLDLGLYYASGPSSTHGFAAYSDTDWAACINTSRSTQGYAFLLSGGAISWSSRLQTRPAKSSTDAEYIGLGHMGSEAVHLDQQLTELGEPLGHPFVVFGDNQGAIALTKEARFHNSTKCIRLAEHIARDLVETGIITVEYIPTADMVADIMTKALPRPAFERCRDALGIRSAPL